MELHGIECYYARMRYSTVEPKNSAEMVAAWILWTTGCIPIDMKKSLPEDEELPFYTVIPPICKQFLPDWQIKKRKCRTWKEKTRICRAEAAARLLLFNNAQENNAYAREDNPIGMRIALKQGRKKRGGKRIDKW